MSSIKEFYIEKEKRELINTISSAKYVSKEQKEAMIAEISFAKANKEVERAKKKRDHHTHQSNWHADDSHTGAGDKYDMKKAADHGEKAKRAAKQHRRLDHKLQKRIQSRGDAQKYLDTHGRAPEGWASKKGKIIDTKKTLMPRQPDDRTSRKGWGKK